MKPFVVCIFLLSLSTIVFAQFDTGIEIGVGIHQGGLALGDIDGDTDQDLILAGYSYYSSNRFDKYINNGGSFSGPVSAGCGYGCLGQ